MTLLLNPFDIDLSIATSFNISILNKKVTKELYGPVDF